MGQIDTFAVPGAVKRGFARYKNQDSKRAK